MIVQDDKLKLMHLEKEYYAAIGRGEYRQARLLATKCAVIAGNIYLETHLYAGKQTK